MKLNDSAVLYVPVGLEDFETKWKPYLLYGVKFEIKRTAQNSSDSVLYVIYKRTKVLNANGEADVLPDILPGFLVEKGDSVSADPKKCGKAMRICAVENFIHGTDGLHHCKVYLK